MKGKNLDEIKNEGWKEKGKIDFAGNRHDMILVNVLSLLLLLPFLLAAVFPLREEWKLFHSAPLQVFLLVPSLVVYIPVHELLHGAAMKLYTSEKLRFGWKLVYAYCGSEKAVLRPKEYIVVALAPVALCSLLFVPLSIVLPQMRMFFLILEAVNVSGAAGDIYVTYVFLRKIREDILVCDTGTDMAWFSRE